MNTEDREAIARLINQHGHLTDMGHFDRLHEVFSADIVYDVSDFGGEVIIGLEGMRQAALALGDKNPVAHHVTNIVLDEITDDVVRGLSKGIGINVDGTVGSVIYDDHIERRDSEWRITRRTVRARRSPLHP